MYYIYMIKNKVNNKVYIGQTKSIEIRWKEHINKLKANKHVNVHLQNSWNKYGLDSFEFLIIDSAESIDEKCVYKYRPIDNRFNNRKLNITDENEIIRLNIEDNVSIKTLVEKYNVSYTTVSLLIHNYKNTI